MEKELEDILAKRGDGKFTVNRIKVIKAIRAAATESNLKELKDSNELTTIIIRPINELLEKLQGIRINDRVRILATDTRYRGRYAKVSLIGGDVKAWDVGVLMENDESTRELYYNYDEIEKA